ncbi:hypothetical protein JOD31_003029 [Methylopila capsulata]|uniref:Uncharacterized protein n=1 Tax=Methylopila capsulata TaxID=61654 RepID=A0A9W6MT83_9HYPH|nr:hypothetical protein [Methylopila capsulata]MBM7852787.1 hypothetical protein [Methylopila capsulata]GLK56997.1 hypothetical protein GCM10008170_30160 [Methylopila capsulata]
MSLSDAREQIAVAATYDVAARARRALTFERAGRFGDAWREWEALRATEGRRADWNAPLAASYLRFAFDWTADGSPEPLHEAEEALVRGVAILSIDLAEQPDDVARLLLIARACEQRCLLRAYGEGWTRAARSALEAGEAPEVTGDPRQIAAAGAAATAALDLVAIHAPSLATLATELAQSCLRLAATLEASGAGDEAAGLMLRAETVLRGPTAPQRRPALIAIEGGAPEERTPPRRPALTLVTSRTA